MHRRVLHFLLIGITLLVFGGISNAEPIERGGQHDKTDDDWSVRIGAIGIYKPEYEGSDKYEVMGLPLIDIMWRDTVFLNFRNGLGAYVLNSDKYKIALSIGYSFGRDEDDSVYLHGLGDIDEGATANVFFKWTPGDVDLNARYEHQFTGEDTGYRIHLGLGYALRIADKTILRPSVKTTYANSDYMSAYFGISPTQASSSGLRVYDAGSGVKSFGLELMLIHRLDRRWGIQMLAAYSRLVGDAADSPVVRDENQYLYLFGVSYNF